MIIIPSRKNIDCIVMCGQSNEGDTISTTGEPESIYLEQPNTYIFHKPNDAGSTNNGQIQTLHYGKNQVWRTATIDGNGPELSFGYEHYQQTGNPVLIIKYAYGGSPLVDIGSSVANGLWQWDANPANVNGLPHYSNMVNNFVIPALTKAKANGFNVSLKAFHWCQGETDAVLEARALLYEEKLIELIDKFVVDVTPYGVLSPNFIPIITRIHNSLSLEDRPYTGLIRTAQENVAAHYGVTVIDGDAWPLESDDTHWTRAGVNSGQQLHGEAILERFLSIS